LLRRCAPRDDIAARKLPRSFYLRSTVVVARDLLGKLLVRKLRQKHLVGKIVEVEAYCEGDPASHSYHGMTGRNEVMFWEGGHLYVYFTYGMHFCANVVTREEGIGEAVLIRAVEPIVGLDTMRKNRGFSRDEDRIWDLTNGPAKVCEAFGITRKHNGADLCGDEIWIARDSHQMTHLSHPRILSSSRVGIRNGRNKKWRFYIEGNRWISKVSPRR
jgi:DNA-3-methyladenine glycosylase